ncbi:MAG: hypothetical protein MZV63_37715 [Marinilabiliales bacterium]|nr:hypothetical protein [Marinilabiliales bacterium]
MKATKGRPRQYDDNSRWRHTCKFGCMHRPHPPACHDTVSPEPLIPRPDLPIQGIHNRRRDASVGVDVGLPSDSFAGFIWIPTRNGLARFDGHTFIPYLRKDGLPSNNVTRVFEDRAGTIWAVTVNGLARFNGRNFNSYPLPDSLGIKNMGMGCDYGDTATFPLSGAVSTDRDKILLFRKGQYYDYSSVHPALAGKTLLPSAFDTSDSTLYLINGSFEVFKFHNETLTLFEEGPRTNGTITDDGPHSLQMKWLVTG